jgi:hypothetical protein
LAGCSRLVPHALHSAVETLRVASVNRLIILDNGNTALFKMMLLNETRLEIGRLWFQGFLQMAELEEEGKAFMSLMDECGGISCAVVDDSVGGRSQAECQ